jgi:hypothetical protein
MERVFTTGLLEANEFSYCESLEQYFYDVNCAQLASMVLSAPFSSFHPSRAALAIFSVS